MGEEAVREEFNDAVIVRPSNIYGETDRFLFYYCNDFRRGLTSIPLWKKGEMTIKMPVHVSFRCNQFIFALFWHLSLTNLIILILF